MMKWAKLSVKDDEKKRGREKKKRKREREREMEENNTLSECKPSEETYLWINY